MACPSIQSFSRLCRQVCLILTLLVASQVCAGKTILLVLSQETPVYLAYAQAFRLDLARRDKTVTVSAIRSDKLQDQPLPTAEMLVAVGSDAAEMLSQRELHSPLLITMMPRESLEQLLPMQAHASGLYVDQPPSRYLSLVRAALPAARRIGILTGPDGRATAHSLRRAARQMHLGVHVETISTGNTLHSALQHIFTRSDVLLAIPDATIFNRQTIPRIMMEAYRHNIPVVGFSPAYIEAGALVALYSTPEQLALQSADICHRVLSGSAASGLNFPMHYTIGLNDHIAQSMNQALDDETVIRARMTRQERQQ